MSCTIFLIAINFVIEKIDTSTHFIKLTKKVHKILVYEWNCDSVYLEAKVTLRSADLKGWKVVGIGLFSDRSNYWHLALVEAPDDHSRRHFIELKEMARGYWGANLNKKYRKIEYFNPFKQTWLYNRPYWLSFIWKDRVLIGRVKTIDDEVIWQQVYIADGSFGRKYRPMIHINGFEGKIDVNVRTSKKSDFTLVDSFGQATFVNWPGKPQSQNDLFKYWKREDKILKTIYLTPIDEYRDTGYINVYRDSLNIWWFRNPDGKKFFSIGVNAINLGDTYTKIDPGMEVLFAYIPEKKFSESRINPFFPREKGWLSYYVINLRRRYGSNWKQQWMQNTLKRLRLWGFNTVGNWSIIPKEGTMPFVVDISSYHQKIPIINQKFPDVFSSQFKTSLKLRLKKALRYKTNRYLLGYFVDNELWWGKKSGDLLKDILRLPRGSPAKESLVNYFVAKYDNIERFNQAYHTDYSSFTELRKDTMSLDFIPLSDARLFTKRIAERYFKSVRDVLKEYDPNHLYLGCRFAGTEVPDEIVEVAGRYCDVLSFNIYAPIPDTVRLKQIYRLTNKPIIIGEFHFGTANYGLRPGLVQVKDQLERALFYRRYVETAASLPFVIGLHWFEYIDQPVTGRFDGENYNIGLVNVCDIPYHEFLKGVTEVNKRIYEIHRGEGD